MINKYLKEILTKMFRMVGEKFTERKISKPEWFLKYSWTTKKEEEFKKWLVNYFYSDSNVRKALLKSNIKRKAYLKKAATWFLFDYGFKVKDD